MHEGVEVFAGDEAETRAGLSDGGKGVGLVADEGRKAEEGAGDDADGDDVLSGFRSHGEGDFAAVEDVEAFRGISLEEKYTVFFAEHGDGALLKRQDESRIGYECGCIQLQLWISGSLEEQGRFPSRLKL